MVTETWRWIQKQDMGPSPRYAFSMAYDSDSKKVILFGGASLDGRIFNDTWEWDEQLWTQVADTGPSTRGLHKMVYDSKNSKMVLFGGLDNTSYRNDTWEWDGTEWTLVADTGPSPRIGHAMVYDPDNSRIVLFGGFDATSFKSDTWEWDGTEWTQFVDTGPTNRYAHSMVYNSSEKEILLFGGADTLITPAVIFGDTWKMKDNIWSKVQDMGPGPLAAADMIYDGKRVILFGGTDGTAISQNTWGWRGTLWTQHQNMGPSSRADDFEFPSELRDVIGYDILIHELKTSRILTPPERTLLQEVAATAPTDFTEEVEELFALQDRLQGEIRFDAEVGRLQFTSVMAEARRNRLLVASADPDYQAAITSLFDKPRQFISRHMRAFSFNSTQQFSALYPNRFSSALDALPADIKFPKTIKDRIYLDTTVGGNTQLRFIGIMTESERDLLLSLSDPADPNHTEYRAAIKDLFIIFMFIRCPLNIPQSG